MAYTGVVQPEMVPQTTSQREKFERIFTNFWGWSLAALSIYIFIGSSPLWIFWEEAFYDLFDLLDRFAIGLSVVVGLFMAIRLEAKHRKLENIDGYRYWMQTVVRYLLAYIFLVYGMAKIFGQQFYTSPSTLDTPLGQITGIQLTWRFFGYSYAYTLFVASSQLVSSLLLFFRRTTTLGAVILLPVISNIVFVNFTHQIPVKLYSGFYLTMVIFLLFLDHRRLKALFWDHKPFDRPAINLTPNSRRRRIVKAIVIAVFLVTTIGENYYAGKLDDQMEPAMKGVWEVNEYRVNDVVMTDSQAAVWKKVYFDFAFRIAVKTDDAKPQYFFSKFDLQNRTLRLTEDPQSKELFAEGTYDLPTADRMTLNLTQGEDRIQVTLHKIK